MKRVEQLLLTLIIFLIPTNLFFVLAVEPGYINGLLSDYLLPKIYLVDLALTALLVWWLLLISPNLNLKKAKKAHHEILANLQVSVLAAISFTTALEIALYSLIFTASGLNNSWYIFKLAAAGIFFWYLLKRAEQGRGFEKIFASALAITVLFQSAAGLFQFLNQRSVFGYLLLGEPQLGASLGLSKVVLSGAEMVLPYGTTAHPNLLGGIIAGYLLLLLLISREKLLGRINWLIIAAFLLGVPTLLLTFSVSAWLMFLIGLIFIFLPQAKNLSSKALAGFTLLIIIGVPILLLAAESAAGHPSIIRRNYLSAAALKLFSNFPLLGVGLNQFTAQLETYAPAREVVRFVQPAHHAVLLWLAETGIVGLALIASALKLIQKTKYMFSFLAALAILSPVIALDHYLLSQSAGILLSALFLGIFLTHQKTH